jgi:hypothetical protein
VDDRPLREDERPPPLEPDPRLYDLMERSPKMTDEKVRKILRKWGLQ